MKEEKLLMIKNMVCDRCITAVESILQKADLKVSRIELGEVELTEKPTSEQLNLISQQLFDQGFELLEQRQAKIINQIKKLLIEKVHYSELDVNFKLADYLSRNLPYTYNHLSQLFSEVEGITLEKYYILQKVERVKELIAYDELSISQIADQMGYSSVQHLSSQFKKVTGMTPSAFKKLRPVRKGLDKL